MKYWKKPHLINNIHYKLVSHSATLFCLLKVSLRRITITLHSFSQQEPSLNIQHILWSQHIFTRLLLWFVIFKKSFHKSKRIPHHDLPSSVKKVLINMYMIILSLFFFLHEEGINATTNWANLHQRLYIINLFVKSFQHFLQEVQEIIAEVWRSN